MPTIIAFHFPHKTASMFAFKILEAVASRTGFAHYSQNNLPPNHTALADGCTLDVDGICLRGPVRNFSVIEGAPRDPDQAYRFATPAFLIEDASYRAVCQVRDTLDLVVSQYFSHGWIHRPADGFGQMRKDLQAGRISVYEYALLEFEGRSDFGEESIVEKLKKLRSLKERLGPENLVCLDYEEMVLDYDQWAQRVEAFLEPYVPSIGSVLADLRPEYDAPPESSEFYADPLEYIEKNSHTLQHVRSPYPGDHRRFLTEAEITDLRRREEALTSA